MKRVISEETSSRLLSLMLSENKIADAGPPWSRIILGLVLLIGGLALWTQIR